MLWSGDDGRRASTKAKRQVLVLSWVLDLVEGGWKNGSRFEFSGRVKCFLVKKVEINLKKKKEKYKKERRKSERKCVLRSNGLKKTENKWIKRYRFFHHVANQVGSEGDSSWKWIFIFVIRFLWKSLEFLWNWSWKLDHLHFCLVSVCFKVLPKIYEPFSIFLTGEEDYS